MKPAKKPPAQPSPKLARMLQAATPQQREEAFRIAARVGRLLVPLRLPTLVGFGR